MPKTSHRCWRQANVLREFVFLCSLLISATTEDSTTSGEVFTSISEMSRLAAKELEIVNFLRRHKEKLEREIRAVENYLSASVPLGDDSRNDPESTEDPEVTFGATMNPVDAFILIRRLSSDWTINFNDTSSFNVTEELLRLSASSTTPPTFHFPTFTDLSGAALSLAFLREAYILDIADLTKGIIRVPGNPLEFRSKNSLNARDLLFIGKHAFNKGRYGEAYDWLSSAVSLAKEEGNLTASVEEIKPFLTTTIKIHDEVLAKKGDCGPKWKTKKFPIKVNRDAGLSEKDSKKDTENIEQLRFSPNMEEYLEKEVFHRICRGISYRAAAQESEVYCQRIIRNFLIPFHMEVRSRVPFVATIDEFLSPKETLEFRELAQKTTNDHNLWARSKHRGRWGESVASDKRTSKQSWLSDEAHPIVARVSARIELLTSLKTTPIIRAAEEFQVANYGIGGQYTLHTDYHPINVPDYMQDFYTATHGNRIATFMVYLEDVPIGGGTAFPAAEVLVQPKRGTAVFWWNLGTNLGGDTLTRHGGCPVLVGNKWIINKWIRSFDQMFVFPCTPEQERQPALG